MKHKNAARLSLIPLAVGLVAAPALAAPASADPTTPGGTSAVQSLDFGFTSSKVVDDASYGKVLEVRFSVKNSGNTPGPFEFHALNGKGQNFIDDEGEEMYTGCDWPVSMLDPGKTTQCRTIIRLSATELKSGATNPLPMTFKWGSTGPSFAGFTVPSTVFGTPAPTTPVEKKSLAFEFISAAAKDDANYGPVADVSFKVTNDGTTDGPWEFHGLTEDGKNFIDDEGEEMYAGCESAMSQLRPGQSTVCHTQMRLSKAELAAGESKAFNVKFKWGSSGPEFPGFTVPVLNLSAFAPKPTTPAPTEPAPTSPAPTEPAPMSPADPTPGTPAPIEQPAVDVTSPAPTSPVKTSPAPAVSAPKLPGKPVRGSKEPGHSSALSPSASASASAGAKPLASKPGAASAPASASGEAEAAGEAASAPSASSAALGPQVQTDRIAGSSSDGLTGWALAGLGALGLGALVARRVRA